MNRFVVDSLFAGVSFFCGYLVAHRRAKANAATWFVQPAPPSVRREPPKADPDAPVVLDASFARTNQPGSTSDMDL